MKNAIKSTLVILLALVVYSCSSSKVKFEDVEKKVFSNNFSFVAVQYETNSTFSAPAGTGRIAQTNIPMQPNQNIGIQVSPDRVIINLPATDQETTIDKKSLTGVSEDFTVARSTLENGNILLNFFLKDKTDLNLIKMEVGKEGTIDCSVEGPKQKPLLYTGRLKM